MLELIIGPAGAGKTSGIMEEIRAAAERGEGGRILLVPEQFSFEAERELCRVVGDGLSLYAEVMSFTGLARRVEEELGAGERPLLDAGGRLLSMSLALDDLGARLKVYSAARRSPEQKKLLLDAVEELQAAAVSPESLLETAELCHDALGEKLGDLALVYAAYRAVCERGGADPADRLEKLCARLPESGLFRSGHIYVDGFTDFTGLEFEVLVALLSRGVDMSFCLTCDDIFEGSEVFELSRRTARRLIAEAKSRGIDFRLRPVVSKQPSAADFFAEHLFYYGDEQFHGDKGALRLYTADGRTAECEAAAALSIELVRGGCLWRDVAVAVRGFEEYRDGLEAAFAYYGVPLFAAQKTDILGKPLPALISCAYEIIYGGWEPEEVFSYLRTGLAGLSDEDCDILENYCITWNVRASMWLSPKDWRLHPDGYGRDYDEAAEARLSQINDLRRRAAAPLLALSERSRAAGTAAGQAAALSDFFAVLDLPQRLSEKTLSLRELGRAREAAEYSQLWDACVDALEQIYRVLGESETDGPAFARLYLLTLSQHSLGSIPVSLDAVTAGDMDRMRRRHIKHLIVLGASDERLPAAGAEGGVFTAEERRRLSELGLPIDAGDAELWREFALIYNCVSLPSETISLVCPAFAADGSPARPSFVMTRAQKLFDAPIVPLDARRIKAAAAGPALELAAEGLRPGADGLALGALDYFRESDGARLSALSSAAELTRGRLSPQAVRALYGERPKFSATRADAFASCRFSYFLKYGLGAQPRAAAEFSPPEFGAFMHFILQHVAQEAESLGGFRAVSDEKLSALTEKYVNQYISEQLNDFEDRSARFIYLFRRLVKDAKRIVADMADELRSSDFTPLAFEFDFGAAQLPQAALPGGESFSLSGVIDRVDGWVHEGRLYLRVVDYKTGKKSFSLSDVLHGMGLQMLLYLFTLTRNGEELFGSPVEPAGVLYVPARDVLVSASADMSDEELAAERSSALRRSGLLLDDAEVLFAMENSESPRRLPVKWKKGEPTGEALASAEHLGLLSSHIDSTLAAMAKELRSGSIKADPYYKKAQEHACLYCPYVDACRFSDGVGGDERRYMPRLPGTKVWNILEGEGAQS